MNAEATVPDAVIPAKAVAHSDAPTRHHSRESGTAFAGLQTPTPEAARSASAMDGASNPVTFARYPKYKDSGVAWLGEVPANWDVFALKFLVLLQSGDAITSDAIEPDGDHPVFGGNGLRGYTSSFTHDGEYVLVGRQGALCGNVNYASGKFWASEHAVVVTPRQQLKVRWLGELLRAMDLNQYSVSAAQPGLSVEQIGNLRVPVPPLSEQRAIATFLDRETAKIDALIAEQEKLIALLKEKRQALISHAVTKGLDPTAPMKDSGIEWLGRVPAHWEIVRNKVVFQEIDDRNVGDDGELLTVSHITGVTTRAEKNVNMIMAETLDGYKKCAVGDLVINTMWAWMGALGVSPHDGLVSPSYNVYRIRNPQAISGSYYDYLCRIPTHVVSIKAHSTGIWESRLRLYPDTFLTMRVCLPPIREQGEIVAFLDGEVTKFDSLMSEAEHGVELLKERRAALISAAVTGKIDVRNV